MRARFFGPLCCSLALLFSLTSAAQAQYFGRNKVQYKDFKFEVLKTEHFDIYFYQDERESAERTGRMAERWYARLSQVFSHEMKTRQPLVSTPRILTSSRPTSSAAPSTKARVASPKG